MQQGATLGAATAPALADYKSPNRQYGIDTDQHAKNVASLDEQIKEGQKGYEDTSSRAKGVAQEQRGVSTAYGDVATGVTNQENRENQQERDAETSATTRPTSRRKPQRDQQTATNEQTTRKQEDRRIGIEGRVFQLKQDKFNQENQAQGEDNPRRQPMVDQATQQVQDIEDKYTYNAGENKYEDEKGNELTPQQFTDLKNNVSVKLDQTLASKKMKPLGVSLECQRCDGQPISFKDSIQAAAARLCNAERESRRSRPTGECKRPGGDDPWFQSEHRKSSSALG